mgnify:CR=1 FL=1
MNSSRQYFSIAGKKFVRNLLWMENSFKSLIWEDIKMAILTCKSHVSEERKLPYNWCNNKKLTKGIKLCSVEDENVCPYFERR